MRRVVDFPHPEGPTSTRNSPSIISRFSSSITLTLLSKIFVRLLSSIFAIISSLF